MFPSVGDLLDRSSIPRVPYKELAGAVSVEKMHDMSTGFVNGVLKGSELR